jgi:glycosyltransferase involved in cell wall biosynthesis
MIIGFIPPKASDVSLERVRQSTAGALTPKHELRTCPAECRLARGSRRREIIASWLAGVDVLMGCPDTEVLQVRQELGRCLPWILFMLGRMPRGAPLMSTRYRYLDTRDVLLCTCTADAALARNFFPNSTIEVVPFACDDRLFYPTDAAQCQVTRSRLGIGPDEKVLLYSGRLLLEKNVHTLLKTFRVVLNAIPAARLVMAGEEAEQPFMEFGTYPLGTVRTLTRLADHLSLDSGQVLYVGQCTSDDLRALYNAADVLVNLTLNHDENFGYAQIEAMVCGLPVVGSTWGGLKDTIIDGITGVQVPTIVTAAGVKVDWWAAANAVVGLLQSGDASPRVRQRCSEMARERYSPARYAEALERILDACVEAATCARAAEPVVVSAFAQRYWATCAREADARPPYRRGAEALRLYRALIAPYASPSTSHTQNGHHDAWMLAAPVRVQPDGRIAVNDPICPLSIDVPPHLSAAVQTLSARFARHPVIPAATLGMCGADVLEALAWMNEAGLVLATSRGMLDPECAPAALGEPIFEIREIDHRTDIVWLS